MLHQIVCFISCSRSDKLLFFSLLTDCVGGPDWNPKCIDLGKGDWCGCPVWNDCKFKVLNLNKVAECKGEGFLDSMGTKAQQLKMDVSIFLLDTLIYIHHYQDKTSFWPVFPATVI